MPHKLEYIDGLLTEIEEKLHNGHNKDDAKSGIACNYKKFSIVIKNNNEEIIGALVAYTAYAEIYVDDIWIDPTYRRQGLGRRLLDDLTNRFKGQGYNNINLITNAFQAPKFYEKCGFQIEFVRENKHNPKLTKKFFIKHFNNMETI